MENGESIYGYMHVPPRFSTSAYDATQLDLLHFIASTTAVEIPQAVFEWLLSQHYSPARDSLVNWLHYHSRILGIYLRQNIPPQSYSRQKEQ